MLLTALDIAARTNYLNARQTLRRLVDWGVVPVVNENDTTATDEITFGDNDFLAAQVAILLDARLLVLLTNVDGLFARDPAQDPAPEMIAEVKDFADLKGLAIGDRTSAFGSGGMRSKVAAAEMASEAGIPAVICNGTEADTLIRAAAGERVGTRFAAAARARVQLQALAQIREAEHEAGSWSTPARRGCFARAARACCRLESPMSSAPSKPATRSRSPATAPLSARASSSTPRASSRRSRECRVTPSASCSRMRQTRLFTGIASCLAQNTQRALPLVGRTLSYP